MNHWLNRLRFLWEEEISPPEEGRRGHREESAGVPRPLRRAAHFGLVGTIAITLLSQVVETRLIAPVDASPSYKKQCELACDKAEQACNNAAEQKDKSCNTTADNNASTCLAGCPGGKQGDNCRKQCQKTQKDAEKQCDDQEKQAEKVCDTQEKSCAKNCKDGH